LTRLLTYPLNIRVTSKPNAISDQTHSRVSCPPVHSRRAFQDVGARLQPGLELGADYSRVVPASRSDAMARIGIQPGGPVGQCIARDARPRRRRSALRGALYAGLRALRCAH